MELFGESAVQCFKHNGDEGAALGAFNLFECLNVVVFGTVHDGKNFGREFRFVSGPLTR